MKIFNVVWKNLKLIMRSKSSALIIILAPLLVIIFAGAAFNNFSEYQIKIGYYSESYNELTNSYVKEFQDKYPTEKFNTREDCIDAIKLGKIHTCVIFPKDLSLEKSEEITFYADFSKINLVYTVINNVMNKLSKRSDEISLDLTNILLQKINNIEREIEFKREDLNKLRTENSGIAEKIESLSYNINMMNLSFNRDEFDLEKLKNESYKVSLKLRNYDEAFNLSEEMINQIKSSVEELNSSESENEIKEQVKEKEKKFKNISVLLKNNSLNMNTSIEKVIKAVDNNQVKIANAASAKKQIKSDITDLVYSISSIRKNMDLLDQGFNNIEENIKSISVNDANIIVNPITARIEPVTVEKTHLNFAFPILISLILMFVSILLSTIIVLSEKNSAAHFRNFITPTKDMIFLIGNYFTALIIVMFQIILIMFVSSKYFNISMNDLKLSSLVIFICATFFIFLGILLGYLFKSEETGIIGAISAGTIMLLLSNVILPIESMPEYLVSVAELNPFIITNRLITDVLIFNFGINEISRSVIIIGIYSAIAFCLIIIMQKLHRKNIFLFYLGKHKLKHKK